MIAESAQQVETTAHTPVGSTRTFDFVADEPGDWALHCHMTHHVMNQMGHGFPNLIGIDTEGLNQKIRKLIPGYMTMGEDGMGDMGEMGMKNPKNSIPIGRRQRAVRLHHDGRMFTTLKVREGITDYEDPGWYQHPEGTVAGVAKEEDLQRDGIELPKDLPKTAALRGPLAGEAWCGVPPAKSPLLARSEALARIKVQ
jgi:hypothetical protein